MKKIIFIISTLLLIACNSTIGSDDVNELTNLVFTIDEKEVTSTALIVSGNVENIGTIKISSP